MRKSSIIIILLTLCLAGLSQVINTNSKYQSIAFQEIDTYLLTPPCSKIYINHPNVLIFLKSDIEIYIDTELESVTIELVQDSIGGYSIIEIVCGDFRSGSHFIANKVGDRTKLFYKKK